MYLCVPVHVFMNLMLSWLTCIFLIRFNILCCASGFCMLLFLRQIFMMHVCVCVRVCCVVHWYCSGQLSMFNMEKRNRNKIIIIIIIWHVSYFICLAIPGKWTCNLECFQLPVPSFCLTDLPLPLPLAHALHLCSPLLLPHLFSWFVPSFFLNSLKTRLEMAD